jgi:hypothetical protein
MQLCRQACGAGFYCMRIKFEKRLNLSHCSTFDIG